MSTKEPVKPKIRSCKGCPMRVFISSIYAACSGPSSDYRECMKHNNMKTFAYYIIEGIAKPKYRPEMRIKDI